MPLRLLETATLPERQGGVVMFNVGWMSSIKNVNQSQSAGDGQTLWARFRDRLIAFAVIGREHNVAR